MAPLRMMLSVFFIVTGVMSKPISLSADENSSKCSESIEVSSSEEVVAEGNTSQETLQHSGTDVPNAVEPTDPPLLPPDATALPDPGTLLPDTSAMPDPGTLLPDTSAGPDLGNLQPDLGSPQATDTTALQLMPDDPSQTVLGVDVSQDMPESDPAHDKVNADTVQVLPDMDLSGTSTKKGQATIITYHGYPKGATPPFPPHIISTIPPYFSKTPPARIPFTTNVPVCFTFQFETPEPEPPRGDSM